MSELTGKLTLINETKEYGSNGFKKREFVIETIHEKYPQKIIIETIQDKCSLLDNYFIGDLISISYNINGREWINQEGEARYFNSIQGWRIEKVQGAASNVPPADSFAPAPDLSNDEPDSLHF